MNRDVATRLVLAVVIGLVGGAGFAADPVTAGAVALMLTLPAYLAVTHLGGALAGGAAGDGALDLVWEVGFLLAVLLVGSGLGMLLASSLGLSTTPQDIRYPLVISAVATASLLVGYRLTSPVGRPGRA